MARHLGDRPTTSPWKAVAGGPAPRPWAARTRWTHVAFSGDTKRDRTKRVADQGTSTGAPLIAAPARLRSPR
jgi:hypothetical protein